MLARACARTHTHTHTHTRTDGDGCRAHHPRLKDTDHANARMCAHTHSYTHAYTHAPQACLHAPKPPVWWGEALQRFNIQDIADFFKLPQAAQGGKSISSGSNSEGVVARGGLSKLLRSPDAISTGEGHKKLPNAH
eukprot:scaffold58905_cov23-Tisochrysis_lutea.AAC.2